VWCQQNGTAGELRGWGGVGSGRVWFGLMHLRQIDDHARESPGTSWHAIDRSASASVHLQ
jgi:hypothetical protein